MSSPETFGTIINGDIPVLVDFSPSGVALVK
jgi:hypothetical protein